MEATKSIEQTSQNCHLRPQKSVDLDSDGLGEKSADSDSETVTTLGQVIVAVHITFKRLR